MVLEIQVAGSCVSMCVSRHTVFSERGAITVIKLIAAGSTK